MPAGFAIRDNPVCRQGRCACRPAPCESSVAALGEASGIPMRGRADLTHLERCRCRHHGLALADEHAVVPQALVQVACVSRWRPCAFDTATDVAAVRRRVAGWTGQNRVPHRCVCSIGTRFKRSTPSVDGSRLFRVSDSPPRTRQNVHARSARARAEPTPEERLRHWEAAGLRSILRPLRPLHHPVRDHPAAVASPPVRPGSGRRVQRISCSEQLTARPSGLARHSWNHSWLAIRMLISRRRKTQITEAVSAHNECIV